MTDLAAVTGCVIGYKTLRDGTLRVSLDIEPRHVATFHQSFPENDLHAVIARLSDAREKIQEFIGPEKGGPVSQDAGRLHKSNDFQMFVSTKRDATGAFYTPTEENAKSYLYLECNIDSLVRLDSINDAQIRFRQIYQEFVNWRDRGVRSE